MPRTPVVGAMPRTPVVGAMHRTPVVGATSGAAVVGATSCEAVSRASALGACDARAKHDHRDRKQHGRTAEHLEHVREAPKFGTDGRPHRSEPMGK
jgi:hypothetical protein